MAHVETLKKTLETEAEVERATGEALRVILASLPNLPAADVPAGADEHDNVEVRRWGEPFAIGAPRDHATLGEGLKLMDFEAAARMSGARFVVLKGELARLERAIGQFMLDLQTREHGYLEVAPPLLVRSETMFGTGQLPKFSDDQFVAFPGLETARPLADPAEAPELRWLIPTAEVSLTNLVREQITAEEELPLRLTALTHCFRAEAGASGRDTRGMIRQHQFQKVELVSITAPEQSDEEHERMVACAEAVLKRLELPFRTMLLCNGDMGFSARKTYDLEVWLPSEGRYREISSCSNCGDFQARRMDARAKKAGEKGTRFVHTLNGSGLAVGRTLVAVMENYQDEGGRIAIPQALHPYLPGMTHIGGPA
jgi:seryl-tRNA synthetase